MAGIYLHIPFCSQACTYCDFHFSTSLRNKKALLDAMRHELRLRSTEIPFAKVDSVYFGGGTPSLLGYDELMPFFDDLYALFPIAPDAEVSLEANPDNMTGAWLRQLAKTPVNRLSVGVQSFRDEDLKAMNRAHDAREALAAIPEAANAGFSNISIDLMFGLPGFSAETWQKNVFTALQLPIHHISCYGLTIEPRTLLSRKIQKGLVPLPDEEDAAAQYAWLIETTEQQGIPWYEISNFAKAGYQSRHNTGYWKGEYYLGIGPSAHSYNGTTRSWNISSNMAYIQAIEKEERNCESEVLNDKIRLQEFVLTSLRMRTGLNLSAFAQQFGSHNLDHLLRAAAPWISSRHLDNDSQHIALTHEGLLLADAITSDLFVE
jgi:oxygen-independent coproporphyrinogen-3 oxidase